MSLFVDTVIPTNTITNVVYDSDDGTITITGTNFTTVADQDEDVTQLLDWTKFVWDIDGDDASTSGHTFTAADFASVVVQDTNTIVATLTSDAKDGTPESLELAQGFAADGIGATNLDDDIDVTAGFGVDAAGNPSVTDGADDISPTYSDLVKPFVKSFTSDTENGAYNAGSEINIIANMSEKILDTSSITVSFDTGGTATLVALENGLTMSGTYTVQANETSADLNVSSYAIASPIKDVYGNTLVDVTVPTTTSPYEGNLSTNSDIEIDTTAPTATISKVNYDVSTGVFTIEGDNFNTIDRPANNDVVNQLDWTKFVWDIDNNGTTSPDITFTAASFASAIVDDTQSTHTITATLTADAKAALDAVDGLGLDGYDADRTDDTESANAADAIDIAAGFIVDDSGNNASTSDGADAQVIDYSDDTDPSIV